MQKKLPMKIAPHKSDAEKLAMLQGVVLYVLEKYTRETGRNLTTLDSIDLDHFSKWLRASFHDTPTELDSPNVSNTLVTKEEQEERKANE